VYSLAVAFSINPMDIYDMPANKVLDFLTLHTEVEKYKAEEMKKKVN